MLNRKAIVIRPLSKFSANAVQHQCGLLSVIAVVVVVVVLCILLVFIGGSDGGGCCVCQISLFSDYCWFVS